MQRSWEGWPWVASGRLAMRGVCLVPWLAYAALEAFIGVYAVAFPLLLAWIQPVSLSFWSFFEPSPTAFGAFQFFSLWCVAASTDSVHGGHASPSRGRGRNEPGRDGSSSWAPLRRQYIGGRAWSCSSGLHPFADARTCCDDQLDRRDEIWRSRARPSRSLADSHLRRPQR